MRGLYLTVICILAVSLFAGCTISKPYVMEVDRKDQGLEGNRGYLKGTPPPASDRTNLKRSFMAIDIDLPSAKDEEAQRAERANIRESSKEVTVVREETPTTVKEKVTVKEESIK